MKTKILTIIFFLLISIYSNAQSDTTSTNNNPRLEVKVADGNRIIGTLEKEDEKSLWLKTDDYGLVQIDKSKIKSRNTLDETRIKDGKYWFENYSLGTVYSFSSVILDKISDTITINLDGYAEEGGDMNYPFEVPVEKRKIIIRRMNGKYYFKLSNIICHYKK